MTAADAFVVKIVEAESMFDILQPSKIESFGEQIAPHPLAFPDLHNVGKLLASELRGRNFYVTVPLSAEPQQGYRVRLRLSKWKWKLAGVELPDHIARLARPEPRAALRRNIATLAAPMKRWRWWTSN